MKSLSKDNDERFRKMIIRDFIKLMVLSAVTAIGIVLTLYYSIKNDW